MSSKNFQSYHHFDQDSLLDRLESRPKIRHQILCTLVGPQMPSDKDSNLRRKKLWKPICVFIMFIIHHWSHTIHLTQHSILFDFRNAIFWKMNRKIVFAPYFFSKNSLCPLFSRKKFLRPLIFFEKMLPPPNLKKKKFSPPCRWSRPGYPINVPSPEMETKNPNEEHENGLTLPAPFIFSYIQNIFTEHTAECNEVWKSARGTSH